VELELVGQSVARGMTGRRHAGLAGLEHKMVVIGGVGEPRKPYEGSFAMNLRMSWIISSMSSAVRLPNDITYPRLAISRSLLQNRSQLNERTTTT